MIKDKYLCEFFIVIGLILVAAGIYTGDFIEIYRKATKICYECIGIG